MFTFFLGLFEKKEKVFNVDPKDNRATLVVDEQGNERTYSHAPQRAFVDEGGRATPFKSQENWHVSEQGNERLLSVEERGRTYPIRQYREPVETQAYTGRDAFQGPSPISKTKDAFRGFVSNRVDTLKSEEKLRQAREKFGRETYEAAYRAKLPIALEKKAEYDLKKKYGLYSPEEQARQAKQKDPFTMSPGNVNKAMFGYDPNEKVMKKKLIKRGGKWVEAVVETDEMKHKGHSMGGLMFGSGQPGPFSQPQGGYGGGPSMYEFPQNVERNMEKELPRKKKYYSKEEPEEQREIPRSRGMYDF